MDEIDAFFDFTKEFKRQPMPRGAVSGNIMAGVTENRSSRPVKREFMDDKYALEAIRNEARKMEELELSNNGSNTSQSHYENNLDDLDGLSDDEYTEDVKNRIYNIDDGVYSRYRFDMNRDDKLPIFESREKILDTIKQHPVIVIEGDTGCGKTTQVPQYILDEAFRNSTYCKICVTQPRRIAAMSIAKRVSKERKWNVGSVVGYQVGLRRDYSEDTRIVYCTTGVLLQQLIKEKSLNFYTHIILDEVHERDQDMDFLLIVIRRMLRTVSKHVKIILMSATINTDLFSKYFAISMKPAPVLRVDTRRMYTVNEFYLEGLFRINKSAVNVTYEDPSISPDMYELALKLVLVIDNIEANEQKNNPCPNQVNTSILIFLPGINEIHEMCKLLESLNESKDTVHNINLYPLRLHSLISTDEQNKVFNEAPDGYRKVILATNIAESSITVPDVKYVIDFCLTKSLITDTSTNFTSLVLQWASRANCRQRAGRAGRVMNGRVYRLVTKTFYDEWMPEFGEPEMLRCPLVNVVLKAKLLDMGSPPDILGLAMNPPNLSDIQNTILSLKEVGALFKTVDNRYTEFDGDLTFVGRIMAALPLDIRLTRLIIFGYLFSTLEETIIMAAGLSVRSIFVTLSKHRPAEPYIQKLTWADASGSDLFAIYKAYRVWRNMNERGLIRGDEDEKAWANRFLINLRSMQEMHLLVQEITDRLLGLGIKHENVYQRVQWIDREMSIVLKIVIAGAFYPYYFTRSHVNNVDRERGMYQVLCGRDPCNTVYFTGFNARNIGELYSSSIKQLFREVHILPENVDVNFQEGSERVFVTFKNNQLDNENASGGLMVPGRVLPEVYKAVRMRYENINTTIRVMDPRQAVRYAEERGLGKMIEGVWRTKTTQLKNPELIVIPSVFQKSIRVQITHIDSCSKFFARPLTQLSCLNDITSQLNCRDLDKCRFSESREIDKGMLLAAPFEGKYHRAQVVGPMPGERNRIPFKVYFIDYGNTGIVDFQELRKFPQLCRAVMQDMPPRIFECRLANIQPSTMYTSVCRWQDEAMEILQQFADYNPIDLYVYSVVSYVANVIIKLKEGSSVNEYLIQHGFARSADESYLSKVDHDFRKRKQACAGRFFDDDNMQQNEHYVRSMHISKYEEIEPPPPSLCTRTLSLHGPYSPVETKVFSAIRIGAWKTVSIERDSVNSIMIDSDPQDMHERLIVAAGITESSGQTQMTARATTLMPNIHGFGALVTMIFCPTMQLKCNKSQTKYVSILAGLGYNENTMEPLYEEHDLVISLDVDILEDDLTLINHLRYCMDTILYTECTETRPSADEKTRNELQAKIKNVLTRLFNKNRQYIEAHSDNNEGVWERLPTAPGMGRETIYGHRSIFPTFRTMDLLDEKFETMNMLAEHCKTLYYMSQFDAMPEEVTCRLCNIPLENIVQLRVHLLSQLHCDRERQIHFEPRKS